MASNFYKAGAAAMTSNKDDWETPQSLFDQLDEEFHFTSFRAGMPGISMPGGTAPSFRSKSSFIIRA